MPSPFDRYEPTPAWDTYWRFAAERQAVFWKRLRGEPAPWTSDPILSKYKFTNAYRASDRTSQYLIRNVLYRNGLNQSPDEVFFRTILFKLFNKSETWDALTDILGETPSWRAYDFDRYANALDKARANGRTIYSGAYMMTGTGGFGETTKHRNHLRLLERMMRDELPERIAVAAPTTGIARAYRFLLTYPMMGEFTSFQYAVDLGYSSLFDDCEAYSVIAGPGARDGIAKCFKEPPRYAEDLIRIVASEQEAEFERRGLDWKPLPSRPLQLIDVQNLFCEVAKYTRVSHPEIRGVDPASIGHKGSDRPKQTFQPREVLPTPYYPPKWGVNDAVIAAMNSKQED